MMMMFTVHDKNHRRSNSFADLIHTLIGLSPTIEQDERQQREHQQQLIYQGETDCSQQRHGYGTLIHRKNGWRVMCEWVHGRPNVNSKCKIESKQYDYWGYIQVDQEADLSNLQLSDFKKTRTGELYFHSSVYFGSFEYDMKCGFGTQIEKNGDRYIGGWYDDQYNSIGTFIHNDGTLFQGNYKNGERRGNGTMYWPNGDCMKGVWSGNNTKNAVFYKGQCNSTSPLLLHQLKSQIESSIQSASNHGYLTQFYNDNFERVGIASFKWKQYKIDNQQIANVYILVVFIL
jgi:hypothetical protein